MKDKINYVGIMLNRDNTVTFRTTSESIAYMLGHDETVPAKLAVKVMMGIADYVNNELEEGVYFYAE